MAELDAVTATIESRQADAIRERLELVTLPCTQALGAGGPPTCLPGESDGAPATVFEYVACEPEWVRADRVPSLLKELLAHPLALHAAYASGDGHALIFAATNRPAVGAGIAAEVLGDSIVRLRRTCGAGDGPDALIASEQAEFLVPPPARR